MFIWIQIFAGLLLIAVAFIPDRSSAASTHAQTTGFDDATDKVLKARNVLFGVAFGFFGITSIIYENLYEMVVWACLSVAFEALTIYEFLVAKTNSIVDVIVLVVASVVFAINIVFGLLLFRTLGRNSSLLFYSAGSNPVHRAGYNVFLQLSALLKMDVFLNINLFTNVLFYLYGAGSDWVYCRVPANGMNQCPADFGSAICVTPPVANVQGCQVSSTVTGQAILTLGLMVSLLWNWMSVAAIQKENKPLAIFLTIFGMVVPCFGIWGIIIRNSFCCNDNAFVISFIGVSVERVVFVFFNIRCIRNFDKGLLEVFARRGKLLGRSATVDLHMTFGSSGASNPSGYPATPPNTSLEESNDSRKGQRKEEKKKFQTDFVDVELASNGDNGEVAGHQAERLGENGFMEMEMASDIACNICKKNIVAATKAWRKGGVGVLHGTCAIEYLDQQK